MSRWLLPVGLAVALCAVSLQAQEGPRRGKIKEVTADTVIITVEGKDIACALRRRAGIGVPIAKA